MPLKRLINASVSLMTYSPFSRKPSRTYSWTWTFWDFVNPVWRASYATSSGRKVHSAGYANDTEHDGTGAKDLTAIMDELSRGSSGTGIGLS